MGASNNNSRIADNIKKYRNKLGVSIESGANTNPLQKEIAIAGILGSRSHGFLDDLAERFGIDDSYNCKNL